MVELVISKSAKGMVAHREAVCFVIMLEAHQQSSAAALCPYLSESASTGKVSHLPLHHAQSDGSARFKLVICRVQNSSLGCQHSHCSPSSGGNCSVVSVSATWSYLKCS